MNKVYLHYVDWPNTSGNHAGMAYICKYIKVNESNIILKKFRLTNLKGGRYINFIRCIFHILYFMIKLKNNDTVFFMEYLTKGYAYQEIIANTLSKFRPNVILVGMVHLTGNGLLKSYSNKIKLKKYINHLDRVWVLGSSLKNFLIELGIDESKVVQAFHYVDIDYYKPKNNISRNTFNVLVQGNQLRDYTLLKQIIISCPEINFTIMQGTNDLSNLFSECINVNLIGYVPEKELLIIMQNSDVALSVMIDTIGSNVITTSLACGLTMVVSDVGSIRDYCDKGNAIFCIKIEDYVNALNYLNTQREICEMMKQNARNKALDFTKEKFLHLFLREKSVYKKF